MKKLFLLFTGAALMLSACDTTEQEAQEQKENSSAQVDQTKVPATVTSKFASLYPNVKDAKWAMADGNYEGKFTSASKEMSVQINDKGDLIQTETYIKVTELPKAVQDYLSKNYSGITFDEASSKTDDKGTLFYQVETKDKAVLFDASGNFIKEEKEEAEENEKGEKKY